MAIFRSDNNTGLCPEALEAIGEIASGQCVAYGDDRSTARAVERFQTMFGSGTQVFFVLTGTAANTLATASLTDPGQQVICHVHAHQAGAESTATERIAGCRVTTATNSGSKLSVEDIQSCVFNRGDIHTPQPGVVSITNPTEFGEVYTPDETRSICSIAHQLGYRVQIDGARFANAVAHLECDPREISVDAGVDALVFGGTKNGLAGGEAVLFFDQGEGEVFRQAVARFPVHRKSTGHLASKHYFITAPFLATLEDNVWLKHATHANAMASRLTELIKSSGHRPHFATQSNGVFVRLSAQVHTKLAQHHDYYMVGAPDWNMGRFMMGFDTDPNDVDTLAQDIANAD